MSPPQRSPEWLAARVGKITASVAAACLGLDPYMSRQKAWRAITGRETSKINKHMRWGVEFEAEARSCYEAATGSFVVEAGFIVHPRHDWLGCSPDGLVGDDGLVEIKCPTSVPKAVPIHHRIQIIVQLLVTGRQWCDYYSWTHDGTYSRRVVASGASSLLLKLESFYREFVVADKEPPRKRARIAGAS